MITKSKTKKQAINFVVFILFGFLASGFFLKMSFSSQAPEGNWSEPWYNDCEEVSIVMVDSFYNNRILTNAIAKKEILRILDIKEEAFGSSLSENAGKIVDLINNFLNSNWKARIVEDPTIEQIKIEIDNGNPALMPVDGRKLNNRYFTTTDYHVFIISGYDDDNKMFIVQEPGTYYGYDYQYSYAVIENAMHDYDSEDLSKGRRVAIFTSLKEKNEASDVEIKKVYEPEVEIISEISSFNNGYSDEDLEIYVLPITTDKRFEYIGLAYRIRGCLIILINWIKNIML